MGGESGVDGGDMERAVYLSIAELNRRCHRYGVPSRRRATRRS